jgi:hypothetical protein
MRTRSEIARRVLEHLRDGGTINDAVVETLYRETHGIGPDIAVHSRVVERWAYDAASSVDLSRSRNLPVKPEAAQPFRAGSGRPPRK